MADDAIETEFSLAVAFADGDDGGDFVRGFHIGQLWERMAREADEINETVASDSLETLTRVARYHGWNIEHSTTDWPEWSLVTLKPGRRPDLKVVE